jgi:hypothetical protein
MRPWRLQPHVALLLSLQTEKASVKSTCSLAQDGQHAPATAATALPFVHAATGGQSSGQQSTCPN